MTRFRRVEGPYRVYVGLVPTGYLDPAAIAQVVRDGLAFCAPRRLETARAITLKADVSAADAVSRRHAYTHPEVVRAAISELLAAAPAAKAGVLGSTGGEADFGGQILRRAHGGSDLFKGRGYFELEHLFAGRVRVTPFAEAPPARFLLSQGEPLSVGERAAVRAQGDPWTDAKPVFSGRRSVNELIAPAELASADIRVYCPKLKTSPLTQGLTGAIALGDPDCARGPDSDHYLCDLLELCNPELIVSDAVIAAVGGSRLSGRGHELGAILVANNALAHDWVAAQILNLDALKIRHLGIAAERGWGPAAAAQIELGGGGAEAIRQLGQKSRFWDVGNIPVQEFPEKYERENPGFRFPAQILSGAPYEPSGAHGALLDWIYRSYDLVAARPRMARWPRMTVCVGELGAYPAEYRVLAAGNAAARSLESLVSDSWNVLRLGAVTLKRVRLKNGRRHLAAFVRLDTPSPVSLHLAFALLTLGRTAFTSLSLRSLLRAAAAFLLGRGSASAAASRRVVLTSRLPQNRWWALTAAPTKAEGPGAFAP